MIPRATVALEGPNVGEWLRSRKASMCPARGIVIRAASVQSDQAELIVVAPGPFTALDEDGRVSLTDVAAAALAHVDAELDGLARDAIRVRIEVAT